MVPRRCGSGVKTVSPDGQKNKVLVLANRTHDVDSFWTEVRGNESSFLFRLFNFLLGKLTGQDSGRSQF